MKRVPATAMVVLTMAAGASVALAVKCIDDRVNSFAGVGGREVFEQQRAKHLERLRQNDHVKDESVRAADAAAIDAERDRLGKGDGVQELGEELRRVK